MKRKDFLIALLLAIFGMQTALAEYHYVDLGLPSGTLWATVNVGANLPTDPGDYFAWGETSPKSDYSSSTYKWCEGSENALTKYCDNSSYGYNGFTDNCMELLSQDDAATMNWGLDWRIPTKEQWEELLNTEYTTQEWYSLGGLGVNIYGCEIKSKLNGNSIFLPAGGEYKGSRLEASEACGSYMSRNLKPSYSYDTYIIFFYSDENHVKIRVVSDASRFYGYNIRPVHMPERDYVDLGLPSGTLWATTNIGATNPADDGSFFAWGETQSKSSFSYGTYKWSKGSTNTLTKYCTDSQYGYSGFTDGLSKLLPEDDAAAANWGDGWKMPSMEQWMELTDDRYTTQFWTQKPTTSGSQNYGYQITSKTNGNSVFIPAAGHFIGSIHVKNDSETWNYWTPSLSEDNSDAAKFFQDNLNTKGVFDNDKTTARFLGLPVRPVLRSPVVYTEFVEATGKLTYYYDNMMDYRSGITELYDPVGTPNAVRFKGYNDKILKAVIDPSMMDAPLTSMSNMFYGNYDEETKENLYLKNMTGIEGLRNLNTSIVTNMFEMFDGCSSLKALYLSSFNTQNVTTMYGMFSRCSSLQSLDLSSFNTENVYHMSYMFSNCSSLQVLDISSFNIHTAINIHDMFEGCTSLRTIYCNDDWSGTTANSEYMFFNCISLVGGRGTKYDRNVEDATYARPDGGQSAPGYFTVKGEVYTEFVASTGTLTYYYDLKRKSRSGITELYDPVGNPDALRFNDYHDKVLKAVIDPSMKNAPLTSMKGMFFGGINVSVINCLSAMTSIRGLENLNTTGVTNMESMFRECSSLTMLDLSSFNTQNVTNMYAMFSSCSSLKSIDVRSFNTQNVTNMDMMFYNCSSVQILVTRSWNTQNVTNMYGMFSGCSSLLSVDLGSFNTENVTNMQKMFSGCSSLPSINLSSFNTQNVTDMSLMFRGCSSLTRLDLSKFNTRSVSDMSLMFMECSSLTSLDLSMFNTRNLKKALSMFYLCSKLQTIDMTSFDLSNVTEAGSMFYLCSQLQTIYCSSDMSGSSVQSEYMFSGCTSLVGGQGTKYDINFTDKTYARPDGGTSAPGYFTEKGKIYGEVYTEFDESTGTLTYYFDTKRDSRSGITSLYQPITAPTAPRFKGYHDKIVRAVIDPSMKNAPLTSFAAMFFGGYDTKTSAFLFLTNLTSIEGLANLNTAVVTDMSYMFWFCSALTSLDLSSFNTENVTNMEYMFYNCSSLQTVNVSSFDISNVTDLGIMFGGCSSLTTIFCNDDWSGSTAVNLGMFAGCTSLVGEEGTTYNEDAKDISYARLDGGPSAPGYFSVAPKVYTAFAEATGTLTYYYDNNIASRTGLTELYDPVGNPDAVRFRDYSKKVLKAVIDPSMKNANLVSMRNFFFGGIDNETFAFYTLPNMASIEGMENLNTASATDMNGMFTSCSALTSLDLSSFITTNVTNMNGMFMGCSSLQTLDVSSFNISNATNIEMMFAGCPKLTTIYCDDDWSNTTALSSYMFSGCSKLVGSQGTSFDSNIIDATYARPDGGPSAPGYFTMRPLVAYTVKYVDAEGNELREARTDQGRRGTTVVLKNYDKRSFFSRDRQSKYGYVSDNSSEVILSENEEENVITVTFRSLEAYYATLNCVANGSMERLAQYTGIFFEGEELDICPANGLRGSDGKYYFTSPTEDNVRIFTFPANITPVVRGGKTYYSAVILYNEDPTVAYYAEFENLALDSDDDSYSFTGLGQVEGDAYITPWDIWYSQGTSVCLWSSSYLWTEPIAEAGTYSVSIYGCNYCDEDEPKPFALGYRTADGEVFIYSDLNIPTWGYGAAEKVIQNVPIPAGASLVVMNEYTEYDIEYTEHYYDFELDAVKLVKTGDYREPIADGIEGIGHEANAPIYNVAGQRLQKMQRGINIVGGKKILVK